MSDPAIQSLNVREFMNRHLVDVFSTMLSLTATPAEEGPLPHYAERVTGSVGFAGDSVQGVVYLHLSSDFARSAAAAMLGMTPEEISSEEEVNDVIGEVTNMLTGGLKSALCDAGTPCAVSTPAIIRGRSFAIEPPPDLQRLWCVFDCGSDRVIVEIHIQYN
jgi:chemotaxis protein CheX